MPQANGTQSGTTDTRRAASQAPDAGRRARRPPCDFLWNARGRTRREPGADPLVTIWRQRRVAALLPSHICIADLAKLAGRDEATKQADHGTRQGSPGTRLSSMSRDTRGHPAPVSVRTFSTTSRAATAGLPRGRTDGRLPRSQRRSGRRGAQLDTLTSANSSQIGTEGREREQLGTGVGGVADSVAGARPRGKRALVIHDERVPRMMCARVRRELRERRRGGAVAQRRSASPRAQNSHTSPRPKGEHDPPGRVDPPTQSRRLPLQCPRGPAISHPYPAS